LGKEKMKFVVIVCLIVLGLCGTYFALGRLSPKVQSYSGPIPAAGDFEPKSYALTVVVKDTGVFEVDGALVDLARVKKLLAEKKWDDQTGMKIKRDPKAPYTAILPILDAGRQSGVSHLTVE
jgi:biopolymer transport protein ExbD